MKNRTSRDRDVEVDRTRNSLFFYVAPSEIDPYQLVRSGLLPLAKRQASILRSKGSLPGPGDTIIVLRKVDALRKRAASCRYDLVSLCQVVDFLRKLKNEERIAPQLTRAIDVTEVSIGKASQKRYASFLSFQNAITPPIILPASEADYKKALRRFPLLAVRDRINSIISKMELSADFIRGYMYDLQLMKLDRLSEVLSRVDDSLLEKEIESRVLRKETYEMVNRLHKLSLRARGADLQSMDWAQVEDICAQLVQSHGLDIAQTKKTSDGGVDFYATDRETPFRRGVYVFQVKRTASVGVDTVRQLYSVLDEQAAVKGVIMTTGTFTRDAYRAAEGKRIELVGGAELRQLLRNILAEGQKAIQV